jgi:hypothetical protein
MRALQLLAACFVGVLVFCGLLVLAAAVSAGIGQFEVLVMFAIAVAAGVLQYRSLRGGRAARRRALRAAGTTSG